MSDEFNVLEYSLLQYTIFNQCFVRYTDLSGVLAHICQKTGDCHFKMAPAGDGVYLFKLNEEK